MSFLRVTTDGEILKKCKNNSSRIAVEDQGLLKKQEISKHKEKTEAARTVQARPQKQKSFLDEDASDSAEVSEFEDENSALKKKAAKD